MAIVIKKTVAESALTAEQIRTINLVYPVGSYYKTSDTSFDPNEKWTGTWVKSGSEWHRTA